MDRIFESESLVYYNQMLRIRLFLEKLKVAKLPLFIIFFMKLCSITTDQYHSYLQFLRFVRRLFSVSFTSSSQVKKTTIHF